MSAAFAGTLRQPRVGRHVRLRHHVARVGQVDAVPLVAVAAADAVQVRARCACCPTGTGGRRRTRRPPSSGRSARSRRGTAGSSASGSCSSPRGCRCRARRAAARCRASGPPPARWSISGRTAARSRPGRRPRPPGGSARSSGAPGCVSMMSWREFHGRVVSLRRARGDRGIGASTALPPATVFTTFQAMTSMPREVQQAAEQADHVERDRSP